MTINFSGIKNAGAIKYASSMEKGLCSTSEELTNQKIWVQLTNENGNDLDEFKPLLEKYPSEPDKYPHNDNFLKIDFSTEKQPLEDSYISINDVKINFKDIPTKDVPVVSMVKKLFAKISAPEKKLEYRDTYISSKKAFDNTEFEGFNNFAGNYMVEIVKVAHEPNWVKDSAKEGIATLNSKLNQAFS